MKRKNPIKWSARLFLFFVFAITQFANAQITNYKFSTTSGSTFTAITGGTTIVAAGSAIGAPSTVQNIGFTFNYLGKDYTQFSANAAGLLRLGSTVVTNENVNNISTVTNTPKIFAWWDALYTSAASQSGGVSFVVTGSAPNRELTVQWKVSMAANNTTNFQNYQVKLYETSNKIEFLYGVLNTTGTNSSSIGLGGFTADEYLNIYTTATGPVPSFNAYDNNNTLWPGANTVYTFTPIDNDVADCGVNPLGSGMTPTLWLKADAANAITYSYKNVAAANRSSNVSDANSWTTTTFTPANSVMTNSTTAWLPNAANGGNVARPTGANYLQLNLGSVQSVDGLVIAGCVNCSPQGFLLDYTVTVSSDGTNWTSLGQFKGPAGATDALKVHNDFASTVSCQYIRIYPGAYSGFRALRTDAYTKTSSLIADNTKASFWKDQTFNNNNGLQNTVANQMTFKSNQINGNPAMVSVNASNTWFDIPDQANLRTTFWVLQDKAASGTNYYHVLYGNGTAPYYHSGTSGQLQYTAVASDAQVNWVKDGVDAAAATTYDFGATGNANLITSYANALTSPLGAITIAYQAGNTRSWDGPIAEIISYQHQLSIVEQKKVQSYLAIKYGIGLKHSYLAIDSTVLYDSSANSAYLNNVFGIGRSDCNGLHQRQSSPVIIENNLLTIGNNNIIGTANSASNNNDLAVNNSFLLVGDNGKNLAWVSNCTNAGPSALLKRVWKVQETGTVGSVKLKFNTATTTGATSSLPLAYSTGLIVKLIVSNDTTFDAADSSIVMTYDAATKTYSVNVDLKTGQYFTVSANIAAPGGVTEGLQHWLKADNATITLANGATMANWPDASSFQRTINKLAGTPIYKTNALNFNPTVYFNASSYFGKDVSNVNLSFTSAFTGAEVFGMVKSITNNAQRGFPWDYGSGSRGNHFTWSDGTIYDGFATTSRYNYIPENLAAAIKFSALDWSLYNTYSGAGTWGINRNATSIYTRTSNTVSFTASGNGITIGAESTNIWNGYAPEIVLYDRVLSAAERIRVNTYFAIKYGLTLTTDFVGTDGTTKWWDNTANAAYKNNIFGIGRADCQGLHQRQSKSYNETGLLMIGNNNIIDTTNGNATSVGNNISTDNSLMLVGDNGAVPAWTATGAPTTDMYLILNRKWKVQETGTIGSVKLSFYGARNTSVPLGLPQGNENGKLFLITSPDSVYTDANNTITPLIFDGLNWNVNIDLSNGQYFTIVKITESPGGILVAPTIWYKADMPGTTPTTKWWDQGSSQGDVTAAVAFANPTAASRLANFNPAYTFNGTTQYFYSSTSNLVFPNTDQELYGVSLPTTNPTYGGVLGLGTIANNPSQSFLGYNSNKPTFLITGTGANSVIPSSALARGYNWELQQGVRSANNFTQYSWDSLGYQTATATGTPTVINLDWIAVGANRSSNSIGSFFGGFIPETFAFSQVLTNDQRNRVRTYLAIKYGITLNHSYFDGTGTGTGTKIWDTAVNKGFNNNIFGIGRDDIQSLHQRQSVSINAGAVLMMGNKKLIGTLNSAATGNDITTDKTYLIIGDNGVKASWAGTGAPTGQYTRLKTTWKVQETGTIDSVKLSFFTGKSGKSSYIPNAASAAVKMYLYVSADSIFNDNNNTIYPLTYDATTKNWNVNVDFSNGQYFTLIKDLDGPGCIDAGPVLWFKANDPGAIPTTVWEDQSGNAGDVTAPVAFANPGLTASKTYWVNYNPSYNFNGTTQYFSNNAYQFLNQSQEHYAIVYPNSTATIEVIGIGTKASSTNSVELRFDAAKPLYAIANPSTYAIFPTALPFSWLMLHAGRDLATTTNNLFLEQNGTQSLVKASNVVGIGMDWLNIGARRISAANDQLFKGNIAEIVTYDQILTEAQRNRVRTYLAIKYGITLNHDYVNGKGSTIFSLTNNTGFTNNIIGIGREDCQNLHQRQSLSVNNSGALKIGNNNIIDTTYGNSSLAGNNIASDTNFLVLGDDNGDLTLNYLPIAKRYYFNRTWKLQETGVIGSVKIAIPGITNTATTKLPLFEGSPFIAGNTVYLAQDDDGNFANGGTILLPTTKVGTGTTLTYEVNVDLNNSKPYLRYAVLQDSTDTDKDGVFNTDDIDDDNDGALDIVEYGTCTGNFDFTATNLGTTSKTYTINNVAVTQISSQASQSGSDGVGNLVLGGTNWATLSFSKPTVLRISHADNATIDFTNTDKFTVTSLGTNFNLLDPKSNFTVNANTLGTISVTPKAAANDNTEPWTILTSPITSIKLLADYASTTNFSDLKIRMICTRDTDGDGIPNDIDVDSDGDGCADARESGATGFAPKMMVEGPVGVNGLVDSIETAVDNADIKFTSIYTTFALDNTIDKCADYDNDGVTNAIDLDDDNDGVLDIDEQLDCVYTRALLANLTFNGGGTVTAIDSTITGNNSGAWATRYSDQAFKLPLHLEYTTNTAAVEGMIGLLPVGNTKTTTNWNDAAYKMYHTSNNIYGYLPGAWNYSGTYPANSKVQMDISTKGVVIVKVNGLQVRRFVGKVADYNLAVSSKSSRTYNNVKLTSWTISTSCTDQDTDGDGVVNRLDIDSDGDGCNDGVESGAAAVTTTIPFNTAVGANGVADVVETASESGMVKYDNTYDFFGMDKTKVACDDNDNDGVLNHFDLDDDNDGVLDLEEQTSCLYDSTELVGLTFTGNGTITQDVNSLQTETTSGWVSTYSNETLKLPIHLEWTTNTANYGMIGLIPVGNTTTVSDWTDGSYKIYHTGSAIWGYLPKRWNFTRSYVAGQKMEIDINTSGIVIVKQNGVQIRRFKGKIGDYKLALSSYSTAPKIYSNVYLTSWTTTAVCTDLDTDGDGVPNRFDIDSDGDGCNDGVEAGAASKTTTIPFTGAVGANGLVNSIETASESGLVGYDITYDFFALNKNQVACDDKDNDGILNHLDVDDDNDGVLDVEEQKSCVYQAEPLDDLVFNGNSTVGAYDQTILVNATSGAANTSGWTSSYSTKNFKLPIHFEFSTADLTGTQAQLGLIPISATKTLDNFSDGGYKFHFNATTVYGKFPNQWNFNTTYAANQLCEIDINESGVLTVKVNGNVYHRIQAPVTRYQLATSSASNTEKVFDNVKLTSWGTDAACIDIDTDKDGIVNRLDVDSDGDGCNDGVEASAVLKTVTVPLTYSVGLNGFADTLETALDNSDPKYNSTYKFYGLNKEDNACNDTDGDGIGDILDIDKDNDGLADYIENECSSPLFVTRYSNSIARMNGGVLFKNADSIKYTLAFSGGAATFNGANYDGGNGINFFVNDGVKNYININMKLSPYAAESNPTQTAPIIRSVDFGPSVPFNSVAKANNVSNEPQNIVLTWPGAFGIVYDPDNQLSTHNTGDTIYTGNMLTQNITIAHNGTPKPTWKVTMYMSTDTTLYEINASIFGDNPLYNEGYGFDLITCGKFDDDADGISNEYDLDSDGDGCSDAFEGGVPTATSSTTNLSGNVGVNGLVNTLEYTDDLVTKVNYKPTNYLVKSSFLNKCLDTDGDGIKDIIDIDDDNDGILDAEELSCSVADITIPSLTTSPNVQTLTGSMSRNSGFADYEMNLIGVGTIYTGGELGTLNTSFDNSKGGLHYKFADNDNIYGQTFYINPSAPSLLKKIQFGVNIPTNQMAGGITNDRQTIEMTWSPDVPAIVFDPNDQLETYATGDTLPYGTTITTRADYAATGAKWRIDFMAQGIKSAFFLQTSHKAATTGNFSAEAYGISVDLCAEDDLDDDDIANQLDTDSDGDGCSDAFESGAANAPGGPAQTVPGPYGVNGFANSLEKTSTDGFDEGINYPSTAYMALSSVSSCADTDNDGIPDRDDIDDDNDGILDYDEYFCAVGQFVKSYVVGTGLGMGYGGTFNNGNNRGTGTWAFTEVSSFSSVTDANNASSYKINDGDGKYMYKATFAPTSGTLAKVVYGPNLDGNNVNSTVVNAQQSIKVSWNLPIGGIINDPDDQLSSHADGQGINPGDTIITRAGFSVGNSTWKITIPLNFINTEFVMNNTHISGSGAFGDESFGIAADVCIKKTDMDGDKKGNAVDPDSDGDGCFDAVESQSMKWETLTSSTIAGPYGSNGLTSLLETDTTVLAKTNYVLSKNFTDASVKGCLNTDSDATPDVLDIDDDNDGMLDQDECPKVPPVKKFSFETMPGGRTMYIKDAVTGVRIGKVSLTPIQYISALDELSGNAMDYSVSGHWTDAASDNATNRMMKIRFEPVAPYLSLDLKVLASEGGNGQWWFHPRSLRVDGGIAGNGVIKSIPQRYYLREKYKVGDSMGPNDKMTTAFSGALGPTTNKVFIQVQFNALATTAAPLDLKYTWNALAGTVANENFGFQILEIVPSKSIGTCDYDKDGIPDDLDFDSDNDGCPDVKEAGHRKTKVIVAGNPQVAGPNGTNGYSKLVESNDSQTATHAYTIKATDIGPSGSVQKDYVNELYKEACTWPYVDTLGPRTFCQPDSVGLKVNLNGGIAPVSYQWYRDSVIINGATTDQYVASVTGEYYCILTYADNSTKDTDPMYVEANPLPTKPVISGFKPPVCIGKNITLSSSYAARNQWYFNSSIIVGATKQNYDSAKAGTYFVSYTDLLTGCKNADTIVIAFRPNPEAPVSTLTQPTCSVPTGIITVTSPVGTAFTYSIDNGQTYQASAVFNGVASGTYNVLVADSVGCISDSTKEIITTAIGAPSAPIARITQPNCTSSKGTIVVTSPIDVAFTYSIDGTSYQADTTFANVAAGNYTLYVKGATGCVSTSAITVNAQPASPIAPTVTLTQPTCASPTGKILVTAPTGTGYTYSIDGTAYQAGTTFSGLAANSYPVTVKNATGCVSPASVAAIIAVPSAPAKPTVTVAPSGTVCSGTAVTLTSSSATGNQWYNNGIIINGATSATYTTSLSGIFTVVVTNADGCAGDPSIPDTITVNAKPTATIAQGASLVADCANSGLKLTATSSITTATYQWFLNGSAIGGATDSIYIPAASGSYTVKITNFGCSDSSAPTKVTTVPSASAQGATAVCMGDSILLSTSTVATSYQWQVSVSGAAFQNVASGGTSNTYKANASGSYRVMVDGESYSCPINITVNNLPTVTVVATPSTTICAGSMVGLKATAAGMPGFTYQWQVAGVNIAAQTNDTLTASTSGNYAVVVTDTNGCRATSATSAITVNNTQPAPKVTVLAQPNCTDSTGTIAVTPTGVATDKYSIDGTNYQVSDTFKLVAPGTYSVTVKTIDGCISPATSVTIDTAPAKPSKPNLTVTQPSCALSTGIITVTDPLGTDFTYSVDGTKYQAGVTFNGLTPATYHVTVSTAAGCISPDSVIVINAVPNTPAKPTVTVLQPSCTIATGDITVTAPSGAGFKYIIGSIVVDTNITGIFTGLASGNYTLKVMNADGCIGPDTTVTINAQPTTPSAPTITVTQTSCTLSTGTLTVTAPLGTGLKYFIIGRTDTSTTGVFSGIPAGTYVVKAMNASGCISAGTTDSIKVAPAIPAAPTVTITQPTCTVSIGAIEITAPLGNNFTYSIDGLNYQSATIFNGINAGSYNVTVKNTDGCTSPATAATINTQPATPNAPTAISGATTVTAGSTQVYTTQAVAGATTYNWTLPNGWTGSSTTTSISATIGAVGGTISVTASANGCTSPPATLVVVMSNKDTLPIITPNNTPSKKCLPNVAPGSTMSTCSGTTTTSHGKMVLDAATGCFTYIPDSNYVGKDTSCIVVCNNGVCDTTIVPIDVLPKKDTLPIVTPQDKPITVCKPAITDMGPGATMSTCSGTTTTSHGKMVLNAATGCFTYVPDSNYVGKDTGCIVVCKNGICDTTIVPINVLPKNDTLPIVTPQNQPITVCKPAITDMGSGATMTTCSGSTTTSHGKMILDAATGCFTYVPDSNYVGKDTGCIVVCKNGVCDTTLVPIDVVSITIVPKIDLRKSIDTIIPMLDGNYLVRFKIKATNPMNIPVDSISIQDDLTKVFTSVNDYKDPQVTATGTLVKNGLYNGNSIIELVTPASTLGAGKSDSVYLTVTVLPSAAGKQLNNLAIIKGKTPFGDPTQTSDDPTINPADTSGNTNRDATPFIIPAGDVIIPGGFSPNGDNNDDKFTIVHPAGSKVALKIFNRWQHRIYESNDYQNDWDGRGPGNVLGDYVPMGTYYYLVSVTFATGEVKKYAGPLTLAR